MNSKVEFQRTALEAQTQGQLGATPSASDMYQLSSLGQTLGRGTAVTKPGALSTNKEPHGLKAV